MGVVIHNLASLKQLSVFFASSVLSATTFDFNSSNLQDQTMDSGQSTNPSTDSDISDGLFYLKRDDGLCRALYFCYVQRGFFSILFKRVLLILRAASVCAAIGTLTQCVDYEKVKRYKEINSNASIDFFYMFKPCEISHGLEWTYIGVMFVIITFLIFREFLPIFSYWRAKKFYCETLKIKEEQLRSYTWQDVLVNWKKGRKNASESGKISNEVELSHRILRFENLIVGLSYKGLLPITEIPLLNMKIFTRVCLFNVKVLLYNGWLAPFQDNWKLDKNYKNFQWRDKLASKLAWRILGLMLLYMIIGVPFLLWQIVYGLFKLVDVLMRNPSILCRRSWSTQARVHLRYFQELDHEFEERLNRAYKPAMEYLEGFSSPIPSAIAKTFLFLGVVTSVVFIFICAINDDILTATRAATVTTALGLFISVSLALIPRGKAWKPEFSLQHVVDELPFLPSGWEKEARSLKVRNELEKILPLQWKWLFFEKFLAPLFTLINLGKMLRNVKAIIQFLQEDIATEEFGDVYNIDKCFEQSENSMKISSFSDLLQLLRGPRYPRNYAEGQARPEYISLTERQTSPESRGIASENDHLTAVHNEANQQELIDRVPQPQPANELPEASSEASQDGRVQRTQSPVQPPHSIYICKSFQCKKELSLIRFALANPSWALSNEKVLGYVQWMQQAIEAEFGLKRSQRFWRSFSNVEHWSVLYAANLEVSTKIIFRSKTLYVRRSNEPANYSDEII